jgi:hypothetical protein
LILVFILSSSTFLRTATLAQLVEHLIRNENVAGSNPAGGSSAEKNFRRPFANLAKSQIFKL